MVIRKYGTSLVMAAGLLASTELSPAVLSAATPATLPGVIDRPQPVVKIPVAPGTEAAAPLKEAPKLEKEDSARVVTTLSSVYFSGNTVIPTDDLQVVVAEYLHRPLTRNDLAKLKYQVARLFYDRGYILVKVVTPPQDLSAGKLKVDIYEARIGNVSVAKQETLNSHIVNGMTQPLKTGHIFREQTAESVVSDLDSLPGVNATVNLSPGQVFGTTDMTFQIKPTSDDQQEVAVSNYGSSLTGTALATLHLEKSNLLHLGEQFFANLQHSIDGQLWSTDFGAEIPTGIYNVRTRLEYLHSEDQIEDRLESLDASGKTDLVSVSALSDLLNTRNRKLTTQAGVELRTHESFLADVSDTKDNVAEGFLRTTYLARSTDAVYLTSVRLSRGLDAFGADDQGHLQASSAFGNPDAWRLEPSLYVNKLSPFSDGNFIFSANGQFASDRLISSDLFVLGGYGSVRGFDPATITGESGYQFSLEYDHNLPQICPEFTWKAGPFIDGGMALNRTSTGLVGYNTLYSAGLGLEFNADLLRNVGETTLRLDWAHPLGRYNQQAPAIGGVPQPILPDNTISSDTFYFRVSQKF